ncbi:riboflavin kinase [Streptomyces sp. NPDC059255]|uniref:riboflavin kinase n=1 Tax=Streptomyces sp. NPDC059255 TaxID=3346793 RepID=UPI0036897709
MPLSTGIAAPPAPAEPHLIVTGIVQHGDARGRLLGFPTANLAIDDTPDLDGVWAALVTTPAIASPWPAAVSIGRRTTFYARGGTRLLEAHLIDTQLDLYDQHITVLLVKRLRHQRRYPDAAHLIKQLQHDIDDVRTWATSLTSPATTA